MRHIPILLAAMVAAGIVAATGSGQSGIAVHTSGIHALHVTKTCGDYQGKVGSFCTIRSSNVGAIQPGMHVVYLSAQAPDGSLDTDIVLTGGTAGLGVGHVLLNATTMHVTISGGSGAFGGFQADATVSVDSKGVWHWDGTYRTGQCSTS
jgi:hypothetical protein